MTRVRLVALLLALCLGCVGLWSLGLFAAQPGAAPSAPTNDAPTQQPVDAATGAAPAPAVEDASASSPARVEVADAGLAVAAFTGRVIDERGQALVGAVVTCSPSLTGGDINVADEMDDWFGAGGSERWQARLRSLQAQRVTTTTGADGRFRIAPAGDGKRVALAFAAPGYQLVHREAARPQSDDVDLGDVAPPRGVVVRGRVVDAASSPVVGARVTRRLGSDGAMDFGFELPDAEAGAAEALSERTGGAATTDDAGRFELAHLPAGDVVLRAQHAEHPAGASESLAVRAGAVVEGVVIALPAAASIRGVLLGVPAGTQRVRVLAGAIKKETGDEARGLAMVFGAGEALLGDAAPQWGERSVEPLADGSFTLRGLAAGRTYRVWAAQSGRGFAGALCSQRLEVPAGSTGVELRYDLGITVTFRVVDAATGAPIEQLWVGDRLEGGGGFGELFAFMPPPQRSKRYPDGVVTIASLRPKPKQTLALTVDALGHGRHEQKGIALPAAGGLDLGTVRLLAVPMLRVHVVDDATGQPIAGAKVRLQAEESAGQSAGHAVTPEGLAVEIGGDMAGAPTQRGTTDAEGRCRLNAIAGAKVRLQTSAKAYAPSTSERIELATTGDTEQQVRLMRGGAVVVTVVDATGAPQPRAQVVHRRPDGDTREQEVDADGNARFEHLPPGRHGFRVGEDPAGTFRIRIDGGERPAAAFTEVDVVDRSEQSLRLEAAPGARVRGVVRENGIALAGANVTFLTGRDAGREQGAAMAEQVFEAVAGLGDLGELGKQAGATRSDDDGLYTLEHVEVGEHRLRVSHKSRAMATTVPVVLHTGDNVFDIDLDTTVLRGIVKDDRGAPVAKARVSARPAPSADAAAAAGEAAIAAGYDTAFEALGAMGGRGGNRRGEVTTDASGAFELRGVEPGRLVVVARAKGFSEAVSAPIEVARGANRDGVEITVSSGGTIKVAFAEPKPFTMVQAQYRGEHKDVRPVIKMAQGKTALFEGLRPGPWEVSLQGSPFDRGGDKPAPRRVDVVAGTTVTVDW